MIRLLEDNPIGLVLASLSGGLLVLSLLLAVLWTLPPSASVTERAEDDAGQGLNIPELADAEPLEAFAVITERPVFNESRQPVIIGDEEEGEEELAEEEVDAPEVELAGVVITPSIRMVTLRSKDQRDSLVAFEGQPLEGDYGSWQVSRIDEREVTLTSGSGEEMQLKLEVHKAQIHPPPKVAKADDAKKADSAGKDADQADSDAPMTRAEEIRQRIAERREELRRAAEEKEQDPEAEEMDYRTAIQSMMSGRNKEQNPDEDQ